MQRDPRIFLQDVLDAANSIDAFLLGLDEIAFTENELVQSAVYYQFAIIGEALNKFSKLEPEQAARISELKKIVSFRNILTHAYHIVSPELVFEFARNGLPSLKNTVGALLIEKD